MTKPKLVYVEWTDAHSSDRWSTIEDALGTMTDMMHCKTVGWLLCKDKDFVLVANTMAWEGEPVPTACGTMHIPKGGITEIKEFNL